MNKIILLVFLILGIFQLYSMDWPIKDGVIIRNFGWNDMGLPSLGVSFESNDPILAADQGELLYQHSKNNDASQLISPLGSWVALDHGGGIIGVYSRMADNDRIKIPVTLEKNSLLGESGISGWANKKGIYFSLFDRKERRWINPAMIVTILTDSRPPQILSVKLRNAEGSILEIPQTKNINQGRYTILVEAAEVFQGTNRNSLAPFKIIGSLNGLEIGVLNFETFSARDGNLMIYRNGLFPVRQIYAPYPAFEIGMANFTRGQVTMEIIVQNAAGLSRNAVFRFMVE